MPKKSNKSFWSVGRGGGRSNNSHDEKRYSGEHDDRMGHSVEGSKFSHNKPRVSFKKQNFKPDRLKTNFIKHIDEDVLMSSSNNNGRQVINRGRGKSFLRGRNSPLPRNDPRNGRSLVHQSELNWWKIFIPYGENFTKDFVISNLNRFVAPLIFNPVMYKIIGKDSHFYVDDHKIAAKLADSNELFEKNGHKMQVRVRPGVPPISISDELKEKLKLAMGKRYVQNTNALDLSKFHQDSDLVKDYWCPLNRPSMLTAVMNIVEEHIPNLQALNLDSNKLNSPHQQAFGGILNKFKNLKILYIGDNKFRDIHFLKNFKTLPLEELRLEGNPLRNKYSTNEEYVSEVRKIFPKLLKLDGVELPPPILFDLDDQKAKIPPTNQVYVANEQAKEVSKQFLELYFKVFDSGNRSPLLNAYHENALFSMTSNISQSSNKYNQYLSENRNLSRISDSTRRRKLLKTGKISVLSSICEMPPTEHDLNSFTMDVSLVTEAMMMITITGLFKELSGKNNKDIIRYFNRTWIIVPEGTGFCIANEELHITYATTQQEKTFMSQTTAIQSPAGPSSSVTIENQVSLSEEAKQHMTVNLSAQTNMNIEWSLKCLEEVNWSFETALAAFQEAFRQGKIPPTAFNK